MIFLALNKLQNVEEIGQGAIGHVSKAIWRGSIVAAKEIRVAGNKKMVENELASYRYTKVCNSFAIYTPCFICRSLSHPNILSLLGTIQKQFSIVLITNYVKGASLHSLIFEKEEEV